MRYIHIHRARRVAPCVAAALVLQAFPTRSLRAQPPAPPPTGAPPIAAYRAPIIALVQPAPGTTIPRDKPVVVLRFAPGELADPIDARSFSVQVDGADRSALFQATTSEAWGPLMAPASGSDLEPGPHQITSRICSVRGTCTSTSATVTVAVDAVIANDRSESRRDRIIDLLLAAARKFLED